MSILFIHLKMSTNNEANDIETKRNIPDKDPLKDYQINGMTIESILTKYKNGETFNGIYIKSKGNCLMIIENLIFKEIIFINPIEVSYESTDINQKIEWDRCVYSTLQIDETIKNIGATNVYFSINNINFPYFEYKYKINEDKILNIFYKKFPYKYKENTILITDSETKIEKEKLSKYFNKYFMYNKNDEFVYYESYERKNLEDNFNNLAYDQNITKFKITGPSNDGKSTSLLYLSRKDMNIVYLNLKVINSLYNDKKINDVLNILMYEFSRIKFNNINHKNEFEEIFNKYIDQTPWIIITKLVDNLIKNEIKCILILDQYKATNVDAIFYEKIEKSLNEMFKIVISFSISDNNDFNNIANSLQKNKGNPHILSKDNQNDYFNYSNLLNREEIRQLNKKSKKYELYELFDFNPKYIYLVDISGTDYIKNKIIDYFHFHYDAIGIKNIHAYLFNFSKSINIEFPFTSLYNITTKIPMKYCYLEFKDKNFEIRYQFNFIEAIIDEILKLERVKDYFLEERDKDDDFENKLKGIYFEELANNTIKNKQNIFFNNQINFSLTVKDIISMEKYENNKSNDMIFENNDNLEQPKLMEINEYYDNKINLLNNELEKLKNPAYKADTELKNINYFKKEIFTKQIELLNKKRNKDFEDENKNEDINTSRNRNKKKRKIKDDNYIEEEENLDNNNKGEGNKKLKKN